MTTKLCIPLLLVAAACGDNLEPSDNDHATLGSDEAPDAGGSGGGSGDGDSGDARAIDASMLVYAPSCDAAVAQFEAEAHYVDDGSNVANISCLWAFDDGSTSTDCAGEHTFGDGGFHDFVLEVTDLDTGAVARTEQRRYIDPVIEASLDVQGGDRTITVNATVNVDANVKVFVEPADLVITDDPFYYLKRSYTVDVKRDGAYTVVMEVEDERPLGPICTKRIEKQLNVYCSGGEHTHGH